MEIKTLLRGKEKISADGKKNSIKIYKFWRAKIAWEKILRNHNGEEKIAGTEKIKCESINSKLKLFAPKVPFQILYINIKIRAVS